MLGLGFGQVRQELGGHGRHEMMVLGPQLAVLWGVQHLHWEAVDNLRIQASCAFHTPLPVSTESEAQQEELGFFVTLFLGPEGEWKLCRCCYGPAGPSRAPRAMGLIWFPSSVGHGF